jgi:hypothetical protein
MVGTGEGLAAATGNMIARPRCQELIMERITRRIAIGLVSAVTLTGSFIAGVAYAADARLDMADAHVEKAILLLKAAQNPIATNPRRPFGGHRDEAVRFLEHGRKQIALAKAYAENPKNQK